MDVRVREAVPDDASRILDVHLDAIEALGPAAYSDEQVAAWAHDRDPAEYPLETDETYAVVAERNGGDNSEDPDSRLVGFGWMRPDADDYFETAVDGEITALYVHPSVARQGVGTRLYAELEAEARRRSIESLGLWASRNAVPFYEAQGYRRVTEHTIEFDDGVEGTVVEMQKRLTHGE
jgi:putative acetyltransferase